MGSFDKTKGPVSCLKALRDTFSGLYARKHFLGINETLTAFR